MKDRMHPHSLANLRPFKRGQPSPNPGGRPKDVLTPALRRMLTVEDAEKLAMSLIARAKAGDVKAATLIWDRLEGKAVARSESGEPGAFEDVDLSEFTTEDLKGMLRILKTENDKDKEGQ